jgi:hypothetical protein
MLLPRGTSWPGWHWWTTLSAAEQSQWAAAILTGCGALATSLAVIFALISSERAIRAQRELNRIEVERQEEARRLQKAIIAGTCQGELFNLIADCKRTVLLLMNLSINSLDCMRSVDLMRTSQLEEACKRLDLFGIDEGIGLGQLTVMARELIENTKEQRGILVSMEARKLVTQRVYLADNFAILIDKARPLYFHFLNISGLTPPAIDPVAHGEQQYQAAIAFRP